MSSASTRQTCISLDHLRHRRTSIFFFTWHKCAYICALFKSTFFTSRYFRLLFSRSREINALYMTLVHGTINIILYIPVLFCLSKILSDRQIKRLKHRCITFFRWRCTYRKCTSRSLRSTNQLLLTVPWPQKTLKGDCLFFVIAHIPSFNSILLSNLKTYLFSQAFEGL